MRIRSPSRLGDIVAGAFAQPDRVGNGDYLPLVGDFLSFNEIVAALNQQGHTFTFNQVPPEVFATLFRGAAEVAETFKYSKLTPTWVRIHLIESRSQTKSLAGHRVRCRCGHESTFRCRQPRFVGALRRLGRQPRSVAS